MKGEEDINPRVASTLDGLLHGVGTQELLLSTFRKPTSYRLLKVIPNGQNEGEDENKLGDDSHGFFGALGAFGVMLRMTLGSLGIMTDPPLSAAYQ